MEAYKKLSAKLQENNLAVHGKQQHVFCSPFKFSRLMFCMNID